MPETAASPSPPTQNRPGQSKQYRCSLCDKSFDSAETLDSHQKFEHSEPGHCKPVGGDGLYDGKNNPFSPEFYEMCGQILLRYFH